MVNRQSVLNVTAEIFRIKINLVKLGKWWCGWFIGTPAMVWSHQQHHVESTKYVTSHCEIVYISFLVSILCMLSTPFSDTLCLFSLNAMIFIIIIIIIIIIEFLTSQLWLGNIHLSWDAVINRIRLGGLICSLKSFLRLNMRQELQIFAVVYMYWCAS